MEISGAESTASGRFITTLDAQLILKKSRPSVVSYADRGLLPCVRTESGQRLFRREDVLKFAEQLEQKKL